MKREDKVISLDLAKQIDIEHKRLGLSVESEWWWIDDASLNRDDKWILRNKYSLDYYCLPAYDTAELLSLMPSHIGKFDGETGWFDLSIFDMHSNTPDRHYRVKYVNLQSFSDINPAEALGNLYHWALKYGKEGDGKI